MTTPEIRHLLPLTKLRAYRRKILVKSGQHLLPVSVKSVAFFKSINGWTILVTWEGHEHVITENLKTLLENLDPLDFFQISRNYVVNIDSIKLIIPYFDGKSIVSITGKREIRITVSKKKTKELKNWVNR